METPKWLKRIALGAMVGGAATHETSAQAETGDSGVKVEQKIPGTDLEAQAALDREGVHAGYEWGDDKQELRLKTEWPIAELFDEQFHWNELMRLVEPVYVEVEHHSNKDKIDANFEVPQQYSRLFDTGKAVDESDNETVIEFFRGEFVRALEDNLHGLPWDKEDYMQDAPTTLEGHKVLLADYQGNSSPEASDSLSVVPGVIDAANDRLAMIRAKEVSDIALTGLMSLGADVSQMKETVEGKEVQFSEAEYAELENTAYDLGYVGTPEQVIFHLVADYNNGSITDSGIKANLDNIIATKRQVTVSVAMDEDKKSTLLIPIPLALLPLAFLPGLVRRRREGSEDGTKKESGKGAGNGTETETEDHVNVEIGEDVDVDIDANFAVYRPIMEQYTSAKFESKGDAWDDSLVESMANDILRNWNTIDNPKREALGQAPLDHRQNPRQVFYAYAHAIAMREMIVDSQKKFGAEYNSGQMMGRWYDQKSGVRDQAKNAVGQSTSGLAKHVGIEVGSIR